jgi:type I restriction enzyme S subunit
MIHHNWRTILGDIPHDWGTVTLRDCLLDQTSGDWGSDRGEVPCLVLRSTNFTMDGRISFDDVATRFLSGNTAEKLTLKANDLLLERSGGGPTQPVGRIVFVESDLPGFAFANFIQRLRIDPERMTPAFVGWVLYELNRCGVVERLQHQTTQMRNLEYRDYLRITIPKPPAGEQAAIAEAIREADRALVKAKEELLAAQRLKTALMQQLFTKGIPGRHKTFKTVRVGRIHFSIPEEWEMATLASHCGGHDCVKTGPFGAQLPIEVFRPTGIRIINITDIGEGRIVFSTEAYVDDEVADRLRDYRLKKGDIIFSRVASVGRLGLITEEYDGFLMSSNCIRLRPNSKFNSIFLLHTFLDSQAVSRQVVAAATGGARPIVTPRFLRRMTIPKPLIAEQNEIADIIEKTSQLVDSIESKINALEVLKKSLLQNLLTGKVRVNMEARV